MQAADFLYTRTLQRIGYTPFLHHEVSTVGLLASAASLAGYVALMEYEVPKSVRGPSGFSWNGRADLWFSTQERHYSIESKRGYVRATSENLSGMLRAALDDVRCLRADENTYAAGMLTCFVKYHDRTATYEEFARSEQVSLSYRIGPEGKDGAYIFFAVVGEQG